MVNLSFLDYVFAGDSMLKKYVYFPAIVKTHASYYADQLLIFNFRSDELSH